MKLGLIMGFVGTAVEGTDVSSAGRQDKPMTPRIPRLPMPAAHRDTLLPPRSRGSESTRVVH